MALLYIITQDAQLNLQNFVTDPEIMKSQAGGNIFGLVRQYRGLEAPDNPRKFFCPALKFLMNL